MRMLGKRRLYGGNAPTWRTVITVVATAAAVLLGAEAALAGTCGRTTRDIKTFNTSANMSEHTTVHNNTKDQNFDVQILRSGEQKAQQTIKPGDKVGQLAKLGSYSADWTTFSVVIARTGASDTVTCNFRVKWDANAARWDLLDGATSVCGDPTALCPTCKISCDKSFHENKTRWNTTFKVTD